MKALIRTVQQFLREHANKDKAVGMAAYMKTDMPFYGVQKPLREQLTKRLKREFVPDSAAAYRAMVLALWSLPHREEKYLAIGFARLFPVFHTPGSMPLYKQLLIEGAWWDFVDDIAINLVGPTLLAHPEKLWPTIDRWLTSRDMWLRRTALICQIKHKHTTDEARLFRYCQTLAHEKEFFIRKAIGWALRQHAYINPEAVRRFLHTHDKILSPLSKREAGKHLGQPRTK